MVWDVDNGGKCGGWGGGERVYGNSVFSTPFCYEPKTALKIQGQLHNRIGQNTIP